MVVDYTRENCKSWQLIRFSPRPVVFIRIVGTRNSANEVFHCVHFECPSCESQVSVTNEEASGSKTKTSAEEEEEVSAVQTTEMATEAEEIHPGEERA